MRELGRCGQREVLGLASPKQLALKTGQKGRSVYTPALKLSDLPTTRLSGNPRAKALINDANFDANLGERP